MKRLSLLAMAALLSTPAGARSRAELAADRVCEAVDQHREAQQLPPLERRPELDAVALAEAERVAALPSGQRMQRREAVEQTLRRAGIEGVRRAFGHVQILGGYRDLAERAVANWSDYEPGWRPVMDPRTSALAVGTAWTAERTLVFVALLVVDEELAGDPERVERLVWQQVNRLRREQGLAPLRLSAQLSELAREHSRDMATRDYLGHRNPEGQTMVERLGLAGLRLRTIGENVARNRGTDDAVATAVDGWLDSPPHRRNMLSPRFNLTGVGVALAEDGTFYFTQMFAHTASRLLLNEAEADPGS